MYITFDLFSVTSAVSVDKQTVVVGSQILNLRTHLPSV